MFASGKRSCMKLQFQRDIYDNSHTLADQSLQGISYASSSLNSGYIWNKTEIKLKQNNFVSVLFQTWLHVK